ncbi:FGGY-family carbohydrate kinase [Actinopolymorpha pittospori]
MRPLFVGLDTGLTTTRAVVYDDTGTTLGTATARTPRGSFTSEHVERDPRQHWKVAAATVARALEQAHDHPDHAGGRIAAVGVAGHGDGLYFLGADLAPLAPAVLSPDTRAAGLLREWHQSGVLDDAVAHGGSVPFAGSAAPLVAWFAAHDPALLARTQWLVTAKDWLRGCLTGVVATDPTDASASFTDLLTRSHSDRLADTYGVGEAARLFPPVVESTAVAGEVTDSAARETGLPPGTPVATGLHDVAACYLGTAGSALHHVVVVAGTFGVNITLTDRPVRSTSVTCRPAFEPNRWTVRRSSMGSGANVDWAVDTLASQPTGPIPGGRSGGPAVGSAIEHALEEEPNPDAPLYLPYLFGGPVGRPQSAALLGLRAWHTPTDILRAVVHGVTFNHRADVEQLRRAVPTGPVHLTGGATRSRRWTQLFADVLGAGVTVPPGESGALGAAMCAAVGSGHFPDLEAAAAAMCRPGRFVPPRPGAHERIEEAYQVYLRHNQSPPAAVTTAEPSPDRGIPC